MKRPRDSGVTLLEVMIVIAIIGIIAAMAVPSYQDMVERKHLEQAAESLKSDLQFARTEAIKRSQSIVVSRKTGDVGAWCYGLAVRTASKTSCDCNVADAAASSYCDIKRIMGADFIKAKMEAADINNSTFNSRRGTINAGGVTFSSDKYAVRVVFSDIGRTRLCTPNPLPTGKTALPSIQTICS